MRRSILQNFTNCKEANEFMNSSISKPILNFCSKTHINGTRMRILLVGAGTGETWSCFWIHDLDCCLGSGSRVRSDMAEILWSFKIIISSHIFIYILVDSYQDEIIRAFWNQVESSHNSVSPFITEILNYFKLNIVKYIVKFILLEWHLILEEFYQWETLVRLVLSQTINTTD